MTDAAAWAELRHSALGLVLTDPGFHPLYVSDSARRVLEYGLPPADGALADTSIRDRIRSILGAQQFSPDLLPAMFLSGRRRYICRPAALNDADDAQRTVRIAVVLERYAGVPSRESAKLLQARRRFHLSDRECETVSHLIAGRSTRETAKAMKISPNTVKQFVRLVMGKMRVTSRAAIVSRVLSPGDYSISRTERMTGGDEDRG